MQLQPTILRARGPLQDRPHRPHLHSIAAWARHMCTIIGYYRSDTPMLSAHVFAADIAAHGREG